MKNIHAGLHAEKYYGIVEGFFSDPLPYWTHQQRLKTLKFLSKYCPRFNTYFYTPKNDPWVEQKPFELYPRRKLDELRDTVAQCRRQNLKFVYGFNPQFPLEMVENDFDRYIDLVLRKIKQVSSIDIRHFCILYDEIPFALNFDEAKIRSAHDQHIGQLHARIINRLVIRLDGMVDSLWLCPPDYSFTKKTPYLSALLKELDPSVPIIWTGDGIFTKKISAGLVKKARAVLGPKREIIYWDNYPVNDCAHPVGTFHIGAFNDPEKVAGEDLEGIFINPMRECEANLIAYISLEDYLNAPVSFDREQAMKRAFHKLFGRNWQPYFRIYQTFSDKNCADDGPRKYYAQLLAARTAGATQKIVSAIGKDLQALRKSKNLSARDFLKATAAVIDRAKAMHMVFHGVLAGSLWQKKFLDNDTFPVTMNKKYLTRQFRVFTERLALVKGKPPTSLKKELFALRGLYTKYQGKNRLEITKRDNARLMKIIERLFRLEQKFFLDSIKNLGPVPQIQMLIKRSQINGY